MSLCRRDFCSMAAAGLITAYASGSGKTAALLPQSPHHDGVRAAPDLGHWRIFRERFVTNEGRVVDNGNGGISHSEGQGYGLLLATFAHDQRAFELLLNWTFETLYVPERGLFAWKADPLHTPAVADPNNASDGDILIAWALGLAADQWQRSDLRQAAETLRRRIRSDLFVERAGLELLLPGLEGFVAGPTATLNPSYYIWPAFDFFHAQAPAEGWDKLARDGEILLHRARFGPRRLPTDWVDIDPSGRVYPALGREPRFGFDAVRIPLYSYLGRRSDLAQPIVAFWEASARDGEPLPAWIDVTSQTRAPYPASEGVRSIADLLAGNKTRNDRLSTDYYSAVLQVICEGAQGPLFT